MAGVNTAIQLQDRISAPLLNITNALNVVIGAFNDINNSSDIDVGGLGEAKNYADQATAALISMQDEVNAINFQNANSSYQELNDEINQSDKHIADNTDAQNDFNDSVEQGQSNMDGLKNKIIGAVAAYASIKGLKKALDLSDTMANTASRLDMMNDGLQTTKDLQNMIFLSAERSRGSYQATADAVSKLGLMAGDAFSSSNEIIGFMEQVNKQFTIAGTEASGIDAAMLQLTQAMGSGVLRGEEYNSILEQAPNIIQSIADYLDVPKGKLKEMAGEGQITADVVKSAMFAAADQTNSKFASMPKTFEQIGTSISNNAIMAFQPILEKLNEIANSETFQNIVNGVIEALAFVSSIVLQIFDSVMQVGGFIQSNWSILSPVIYGVIAALAVYAGYLAIIKGIELASLAIKGILAVTEGFHALAIWATTDATWAAATAQLGLNGALYACPLVWIIIAIIAIIAIIYAVIGAINKFAGTSISATGIICGALMVGAAFIGNLFIALINFAIDLFVALWNFIALFANFFANVFNDPVGAIARLFFDLVDVVLELLESVASAIDTIFGSDLAGSVSGWRDGLSGWVDKTYGEGVEVMAKANAEDYHFDRFEYNKAWDSGYSFGEGIDEKIGDLDLFGNSNIPDPSDYAAYDPSAGVGGGLGGGAGSLPNSAGKTADNTGAIKDSLELTNEDLKYLRDIAEMETINRFTTAEIKVEMTNNNNIKSDTDLDGMVNYLVTNVNEALEKAAEGAHV